MKKKFSFLLLIIFSSFLFTSTNSTFISLSTLVSDKKVPENKTFTVSIIIKYDNIKNYEFSTPVLSGTRNCEIIGNGVENKTIYTNDQTINIKTYTYTLKPLGIGQAYFGSASTTYTIDNEERILKTSDIPITITLPEIKKEHKFPVILLFILIIIILIFTLIFGIKKYKEYKKKKEEELRKEQEAKITLEEKKYKEFINIKEKKDNISKEDYFTKLSNFLRKYLIEKLNLKNMTEQELVNHIPEEFKNREPILNMFETIYEIKYSNRELNNSDIDSLENLINDLLR